MAEETQLLESGRGLKKRQLLKRHGGKKSNKKPKLLPVPQVQKKVKMDKKMKKLIRKRAREYNSDDDGGEDNDILPGINNKVIEEEDKESNESSDEEEAGGQDAWNSTMSDMNNDISEDEGEDGDIQPGITRFTEGCRAFRMAFRNIMKKSVSKDSLVR